MDRPKYSAAQRTLREVAAKTIEFALAKNKAGVIRMRYLARQIYDLLPFPRNPRITHRSTRSGRVKSDKDNGNARKKR